MSQSLVKTNPVSGSTTFGQLYQAIRDNIDALLSSHAGTAEPTYKEVGLIWAKLNASGYIEKCYQYTGDVTITTDGYVGWAEVSLSHAGIGAELINARGTKSSLDERLDVAFNEDGTLKAAVTETTSGEWLDPQFTWTSAFLTTTTFQVSGDQTDIYTAKRRLKVSLSGSTVYTEVSSSSESGGITTVTVADAVLTDPIAKVEHGIIQPSGADSSLPSAVKLDTIDERTTAAGVTIDGVLLKDSEVTTDIINEKTAAAGVTIDGVKLKDGGVELLIRDQSRNLVIQNNTTNPTYQMDIDANEVVCQDSLGLAVKLSSINLTVDITSNGINGCVKVSKTGTASAVGTAVTGVGTSFTTEFAVGDVLWFDTKAEGRRISAITNDASLALESAFAVDPTSQTISRGGEAPNTWYYMWVLYDGNTQGGVLDTSSTLPQMPSGYTYKASEGAIYNDSSSDFTRQYKFNNITSTARHNILVNGTALTNTDIDITSTVPLTAKFLIGTMDVEYVGSSSEAWIGYDPGTGIIFGNIQTGDSYAAGDRRRIYFRVPIKISGTSAYVTYRIFSASGGQVSIMASQWED